jgi:hypothetical protein
VLSFFLRSGSTGLYHAAGSEMVSRYHMFTELLAHLPPQLRRRAVVEACSLREITASETLPINCTLDNAKLRQLTAFKFRSLASICSELCVRMTPWPEMLPAHWAEPILDTAIACW